MASALFLVYLPAYPCFASPRVICNCVSFSIAHDGQSDLVAGFERKQRVHVGMFFIERDVADLRDE